MRGVRKERGECGDVGEAHCFSYSGVILESDSRDQRPCYGS